MCVSPWIGIAGDYSQVRAQQERYRAQIAEDQYEALYGKRPSRSRTTPRYVYRPVYVTSYANRATYELGLALVATNLLWLGVWLWG